MGQIDGVDMPMTPPAASCQHSRRSKGIEGRDIQRNAKQNVGRDHRQLCHKFNVIRHMLNHIDRHDQLGLAGLQDPTRSVL
ncbi:MAG: hypothetical protein ACJAZO_001439 [Myxococcota bacterium]